MIIWFPCIFLKTNTLLWVFCQMLTNGRVSKHKGIVDGARPFAYHVGKPNMGEKMIYMIIINKTALCLKITFHLKSYLMSLQVVIT